MRSQLLLIFAFFIGTSFSAFDESFARNKALPLSAAAYSDVPENCLTNRFVKTVLKGKYRVNCDEFKKDTCFAFSAVNHADGAIILSFRGSAGFLQLVSEGVDSIFTKKTVSPIGGDVSEYFYNAYQKLWDAGMKNDFLSLKNSFPDYEVWITGHSLGGAMATVAASNIVKYGYIATSKLKLYTFGQPRTGDKTYATAHDALIPESYRLTHSRDMVPHIPPENLLSYFHHKNEVWYDNDMTLGSGHVECDADEDKKCSDGLLIKLSIQDHLHYYNTDISSYGVAGCH
jgi:hypothetical protein